ncbi:CDP-glycerol glycerophosphotransferase family protein [Candidatus Collierbacteria bacterium]|nr:CDP-glycerol glycerophosphotransferase family protein [Candidatus Collierbacteria bacterium]
MKLKHLFFVTSMNESKQSLLQIDKLDKQNVKIEIISSDPTTNIFSKKLNIKFSDIGNYYPASRRVKTAKNHLNMLMEKWNSDPRLHKNLLYKSQFRLNRLIGYSLDLFLAEILHSLMTAEEIIKKTKPDVIHISPRWLESPFRRYQSEKLNLENIALYQLAKKRRLRVMNFRIPLSQTMFAYTINFLVALTWQLLRASYHQLFHPASPIKSNKLIIMANYYQLENFIPAIKKLKKQNRSLAVIGKISPEQTKKLANLIPTFISLETLEKQKKTLWQTRLINTVAFNLKLIISYSHLKHFFDLENQKYWQFLFPKFLYYFMAEFPLLTDYLDGANHLFKQGKLLVTPATADNVSQTIAMAAKSTETTVLEFQHGIILNEDDDHSFRNNDYFAVWGEKTRSIIAKSQNPEKIPITGYPLFDRYRYPHSSIISKSSLRQKLHISHHKTKVLLILSVFPSGATRLYPNKSPYQFMTMIFNTLLASGEDWKVIFRPHPSVDASWIISLAKDMKIDLFYDHRELKLEEAIAASDVIISNPSTTTIESMFQQKPILLYDFPGMNGAYNYSNWFIISSGATAMFKSQTELKKLIEKSLYDKLFRNTMFARQKIFLKEYCSAFSKPATDKARSLIAKLS